MLNPTGVYDRVLRRLSRRDLMKVAWALGASAVALPAEARRQSGVSMFFNSYPFSLGVASGDPLPDGIVLWTRLAPQPLTGGGMPMVPVTVQWELAADAAFRNVVQKGETLARPELAHSVHVEVNGLQPAHEYWYRFRAGNELSQTGRTRTAPAAGAAVDRLRFGICGCSHFETGYFTAYRRIAQEQFDFVIHTGDYIYEGRADGGRTEGRVRQHTGDEIYTLVDYRNRYGLYKSDPDLIAAHRSAPFIVSWDDHEVENNYAGDLDENGSPAAIFLLRRAAAYQAYYEHMPVRMAAWPTGPHMRIYRRLQFGNLIDLSVLDTRQWRSDQACNDGLRNCPASLDASRTMLGAEQEKWVFDNLANATARWTVLSQQVYSFARDFAKVNPDARFQMDVWDGYPGRAAASLLAHQGDEGAEPHRHFRRRARALRRRLEARFRRPEVRGDRHRVHQHVGLGRRRRRGSGRQLGGAARRQSPHPLPQRPARLHRLHRDAGDDARRLPHPRPRHRRRRADPHGRVAGGRSG